MTRPPATAFLFVAVFVDMLGYGLVVPLLPFYAGGLANGALLVGALGSLHAAMQFFGGARSWPASRTVRGGAPCS